MSQALRSFKDHEKAEVISRRLRLRTYGLGFWSVVGMMGADAIRENVTAHRQSNPPSVIWDPRERPQIRQLIPVRR